MKCDTNGYYFTVEKIQDLINLSLDHIISPVTFLTFMYLRKDSTKAEWVVKVVVFIYLLGTSSLIKTRGLVSYYLWVGYLVMLPIVGLLSYRWVRSKPLYPSYKKDEWIFLFIYLLFLIAAGVTPIKALIGRFVPREPVNLQFPLKNGVFVLVHGGATLEINHHIDDASGSQFAIDINKLHVWGGSMRGLYPDDLTSYAAFGELVYSPCNGTVVEVRNGYEDTAPFSEITIDWDEWAGNYVVVLCENAKVIMAHLMNDSVSVEIGEEVTEGYPLGKIGSSGNSRGPHLHIHAVAPNDDILFGESLPMLFNGRFLVRNSLIYQP